MTPHLHPRSRLTSSLFGTTLAVSFLVVAIPHIVPCPAPRVQFADSEIETLENRRHMKGLSSRSGAKDPSKMSAADSELIVSEEEAAAMKKTAHECPVPKPNGIFGKLLGFTPSDPAQTQPEQKKMKPNIEVQR